ncbi:MAG: glycosyltransferase [Paraglaciecola sp.]|uniref:glycosyltransferase n=1 Tax=Paraglaciecola sp. TaxID=1920173 RepID=UPI0032678916
MDKIKVLHVTYDMRIGGTEQVIKNLIQGSDKCIFEMSILCIESPLGPFANELLEQGTKIEALSRQPGFDTKLIAQIRHHIKENKIDIVHCHQYTPYVYGLFGSFFTNAKVIFTEHGRFYPDSSSWKRQLLNPILNIFTAATTAISAATKQALSEFENIPSSKIQVVYNGIFGLSEDANKTKVLSKELAFSEHVPCIGTIARLDPIKNHSMMLKAFNRALEAGIKCKLLLVGDGEEMPNIMRLITELKLDKHVILTGYEPKPQNHLALMDIYLLPSLSEGTSMTLLEAMSMGKPCIVTHAGGNPEIVLDEVTGLVTPNDDEDAYAAAIVRLLNDVQLQYKFGKAGKERFNQEFSIPNMANAYRAVYLKCLPTNKQASIKSNG